MAFIDTIYDRAKANKKRVVIPESSNVSMLRSAIRAAADGIADIILVGDGDTIRQVAAEHELDLSKVRIVDTKDTVYQEELVERYGNLEKKALGKRYVAKRIAAPLFLALVMEAVGDADCTFGGLDTTTTEFVMAASGILGLKEGWKYVLEGRMAFDGDRPVQTNGGRCIYGHAAAASDIHDHVEAIKQMRGEMGPTQVKKPVKHAMIRGFGGGQNVTCTILKNNA